MTQDSVYWRGRQEALPAPQAVGYRSRSSGFNRWMYRARERTTLSLVSQLVAAGLPAHGARILDLGAGRGFWVDFWQGVLRDPRIWGVDISPHAVEALQVRFPLHRFEVADAGEPASLPMVEGGFHLAQAYDVLYHLTDDDHFRRSLQGLGDAVAPGGFLLVTDNFPRRDVSTRPHVRLRSRATYDAALDARAGGRFRVVVEVPQFLLLNVPSGIHTPWLRWPLVVAWEFLTLPGRWDPLGRALGAALYAADALLLPLLGRWTPSTRLRVYQRSP